MHDSLLLGATARTYSRNHDWATNKRRHRSSGSFEEASEWSSRIWLTQQHRRVLQRWTWENETVCPGNNCEGSALDGSRFQARHHLALRSGSRRRWHQRLQKILMETTFWNQCSRRSLPLRCRAKRYPSGCSRKLLLSCLTKQFGGAPIEHYK